MSKMIRTMTAGMLVIMLCAGMLAGCGAKESSFFDKMDLIRDFLKGQSGLPITLKFRNNELVEILFSS